MLPCPSQLQLAFHPSVAGGQGAGAAEDQLSKLDGAVGGAQIQLPGGFPKAIPPLPVLSWSRPRKGVRMRMPPLEVLAASSLGYSPGA